MTDGAARRPPGQLRIDIVRAAGKLFLERGFDGVSMRDIAASTGTSQSMLYRHFPSKAALFEATVLNPFQDFLSEFVNEMRTHSTSDLPNESLFRMFNERLYDLTLQNRQMFVALLSAEAFSGDALGDIAGALVNGIPEVVEQLKIEQEARGWQDLDIEVVSCEVMAMVIGTALLDPFLFGSRTDRPSRDRILEEFTNLESLGTTRPRPRSSETPPHGRHTANIPRHTTVTPAVIRDTMNRLDCLPKGWLQ